MRRGEMRRKETGGSTTRAGEADKKNSLVFRYETTCYSRERYPENTFRRTGKQLEGGHEKEHYSGKEKISDEVGKRNMPKTFT